MKLPPARIFQLCLFCGVLAAHALALEPGLPTATGTEDGAQQVRVLDFPGDLRNFRARALRADGFFTPDIAFSIRVCPKCRKPYVFGIYPRLSRAPYDDLAAVHRSIEESLQKPTPRTMYSEHAAKQVPRACPYCGEAERNPVANKVYFCHQLLETGDDLHIEYTLQDGKPAEHVFWRVPNGGEAVKVPMADESETTFKTAFGCHFSLRAVWNEIFAKHWDDEKVYYENAAPGVWLIFRPVNVATAAFTEFSTKQLKADKDKGLFTRVVPLLKIDGDSTNANTYLQWAKPYAEKLSKSAAECFVGISLPELRSVAAAAAASRKATLNLVPGKPTVPGTGFIQRGPLRIPVTLSPLVALATNEGLSLQQACSTHMADGSYALDSAERLGTSIQAALPGCEIDFADGGVMIVRDPDKQERRIELFPLAAKLDPDDPIAFGLYRDYFLRWDAKRARLGPPPLEREVSPVGMPAFIERRIRPAEHLVKRNAPGAIFEPFFDSDGKRCDLCYTSECIATVLYVDPSKPKFADIPDANAARALYYVQGGILPLYIDAQDVLRFPGGIPGLVENTTAILCGSDVSSLASEAERASALADFGEVPDDTKRIHFYAFSTNCAALAPRKLTSQEFELLDSRVKDFLKTANVDPGFELNLHFDLPRAQPKGKVLRRKK